jgi:hypothetical protein
MGFCERCVTTLRDAHRFWARITVSGGPRVRCVGLGAQPRSMRPFFDEIL